MLASGLVLVLLGVGGPHGTQTTKPHPIKPASTIVPINAYYGTMLGQSAESPYRVQHVDLRAGRLVRSGPCVYDASGIAMGIKSTVSTTAGESDTFCPPKSGGRSSRLFIPRGRLINNPSMNFQPILLQVGEQAATSIGLSPASHGAPARVTININPKRRRDEADVFYSRNPATPAGTKQIKELKFVTRGHREFVTRVPY